MKHSKDNMEQIRTSLNLFDNQGALDRLRKQSSNAGQWDTLIAHHLTVFTGIDIVPGTIRHVRGEMGCKWYSEGESIDEELFTQEPKALLIVNSDELGKLIDKAIEQALNCRIPESTIEEQDIEMPEPEPVPVEEPAPVADLKKEPSRRIPVLSGMMVA